MTALSRRAFLALSGAFAANTVLGLSEPDRSVAAEVTVNLGYWNNPNPMTYQKAVRSYEKVFGPKVDMNYVMVYSGGQAVQLLTSRNIDVVMFGSSPVIVGFVNGAPISMIYVGKYITDGEALVVRTDRGIASPRDLKGKKIGTPYNSSAHFALLVVMKKAGLSPGDAQIINTPADQLVAAWRQGAIDAAYIWHPAQALLVEDKGKVLVQTGELGSDGVILFDAICVRNDFKKRHPELVLAFLKEYDRIAQLYVKQPGEVAKVMADYLQLPVEKARAYIDAVHPVSPQEMILPKWMGKGSPDDSGVNRALLLQAQFLREQGGIANVPKSFAPYIDSSFVEKMV